MLLARGEWTPWRLDRRHLCLQRKDLAKARRREPEQLIEGLPGALDPARVPAIPDDELRLMFSCCDPDLPAAAQVADTTAGPVRGVTEGGLTEGKRIVFRGIPFAAPPGVPPARLEMLRRAFDATMKDPDFLSEMNRLALEVRPQNGQKVEQAVREIYAYPADVVRMAAQAIKPAR